MADDVLATARVRIRGDGSGLGDDIKREAGSAAREAGTSAGRDFGQRFRRSADESLAGLKPKVDLDIARARDRLQQLEEQARRLGDRKFAIDADISRAQAKLEDLQRTKEARLDAAFAKKLKLDADVTQAEAKLSQLRDKAVLATGDHKLKVDADVASAEAHIAELRARADNLPDVRLKVEADVAAAERNLRELEAERQRLASGVTQIRFAAEVDQAKAKLRELENAKPKSGSFRIDGDVAGALAKVAALAAAIGGISVLAVGAAGAITGIGAAGAAGTLAAIGGFTGVGDALKAMSAKADAAGAAVKVSASAVRSATAAVAQSQRDYRDSLDAVSAAGRGVEAAQRGIAEAQRGVEASSRAVATAQRDYEASSRAVGAAQRDAEASSRAVATAQRDQEASSRAVATAQRDYEASSRAVGAAQRDEEAAIRAVASAQADYQGSLRTVAAAERDYQGSLTAERDAQQSVNDARREAENQLKDLKLATEDMALSQEDAALSVAEAQQRLQEVLSNEKSTAVEKARADLAVRQAKQRQQDLAQSATELAQKRADADQKGVEGSDLVTQAQKRLQSSQDAVVAAQQRIADANRGVADSAQRIADAQQGVVDSAQRVEDAQQGVAASGQRVKDAQQGVADAALRVKEAQQGVADSAQRVKDAQQGVVDSAQRVKDAQQGVVDAIQNVRDAQQGSADAARTLTKAQENVVVSLQKIKDANLRLSEAQNPIANTAAATNKLAEAMGKLGPKAQEFATFLRGFVDGPLTKLRQAGQEAFLPGVQEGLKKLEPMLASITPAWTTFSATVGNALGSLIPIIGSLAAPFLRFASASLQGLQPLEGALQRFSAALGETFNRMAASGTAQQAMGVLVNVVDQLLQLLPSLVEAGAKVLIALGPGLTDVIRSLSQGIGSSLPGIVSMAGVFSTLLSAIAPISPALAVAITAIVGLNKIGALGPLINVAVAAFGRLRSGAKDAGKDIEDAGEKAEKTGGRFSGLQSGIGKVTLAFAALQIANAAFDKTASVGVSTSTQELLKWVQTGQSASNLTGSLTHDLGTLKDGFLGIGAAQRTVAQGLDNLGFSFLEGSNAISHTNERLTSLDAALASLASGGHLDQAKSAFERLSQVAQQQGVSIDTLRNAFPQYKEALAAAALTTDSATGAMGRLQQATVALNQPFLSARNAASGYFAALDQVTASLKLNGAGLDIHTEKGRANQQALDGLAQASATYLQSILDKNGAGAKFNTELLSTQRSLEAAGVKFGLTASQAHSYAQQILLIPTSRTTNINANIAPAAAALQALQTRLQQLSGRVITVPINAGQYGAGLGVYRSTGGFVAPGAAAFGSGPRGSDTVPAWLDPREFVVRSGPAQRWSGLLEKINAGMPPDTTGTYRPAAPAAAAAVKTPAGQIEAGPARMHPDDIASLAGAIGRAVAAVVPDSVRLDSGQLVGAVDSVYGRGWS